MNVTIWPGKLAGTILPPSSKSQGHRYVIAAALAAGESVIGNLSFSEDIEATLRCMETLGAIVKRQMDGATLRGGPCPAEIPVLDCGESGSTLRFLIPVVLALAGGGVFRGRGRLMQRPQEPYFAIFRKKGIAFSAEGDTLTIKGRLTPDVFELPGNVSSQFITGLMYALPLLDGDSEIRLTSPLESAGYVDMTRDALKTFGVEICDEKEDLFFFDGKTVLIEKDLLTEGQTGRRNFTIVHEGSHHVLKMLFPKDYAGGANARRILRYRDTRGSRTREEWQVDRLTSSILMPRELVEQAMFLVGQNGRIDMLNAIWRRKEYERFCNMCYLLGVSKQALSIRMMRLGLLGEEHLLHPNEILDVYMEEDENE